MSFGVQESPGILTLIVAFGSGSLIFAGNSIRQRKDLLAFRAAGFPTISHAFIGLRFPSAHLIVLVRDLSHRGRPGHARPAHLVSALCEPTSMPRCGSWPRVVVLSACHGGAWILLGSAGAGIEICLDRRRTTAESDSGAHVRQVPWFHFSYGK